MLQYLGNIEVTHSLNNTSDRYLVVCDYSHIDSHHETREEAESALAKIGSNGPDGLAETPWCRADVVAPGETIGGKLLAPLTIKKPWDGTDIFGDEVAQ